MRRLRPLVFALAALVVGVPLAGGTTSDQPPAPTIDSAPPNPSNSGTASFSFSDTDLTATFKCQLDGSGFSFCVSPKSYSGLGDGAHTFQVRAFDVLMSDPSDVASYTWTVDTTTPPPAIQSGPPSVTNQTSASFTFSDSESNVTFHCRLDGGPFPSCTSPKEYSVVPEGPHTFFVRAVDALGNQSAVTSYSWTIDTTPPPAPTIVSGPPDPSGTKSAHFVFSGEGGVSFICQLDGAVFSPCSNPQDYSVDDGAHTLVVKAVDAAGNQSGATAPYSWTVDTVNPVVTLTDKPSLITNQTTASFSFSSNKPSSTYQCKLDSGGFGSCTSPRVYAGLDDGSHTFSVRATSLGNTGLTTDYTWTVDTIAPNTTITSTPPASSSSASANFTFTSSEVGSTFACSLDAGGITPCTSPKTFAGLGDGTHTFRVQAVDAGGNADTTPAAYSWQIAGVGPGTTDTTPPGNVKRLKRNVGYGILKLAWTRPSDSDFDHVKVFVSTSAKSPPRTLVYKGTARKYTNKRFKNGLYYRYAVLSYDHTGNASRGAAAVVPPSILLSSPPAGRLVHGPPLLAWAAVAKASFYNVQLYYGSQKVLSAWPNPAKLKLSRSWSYGGRRFQLRKGLYRWYVWPSFGPRTKARYGQLLGQSTFSVR